jgi:hypothetical protein
MVEEFGAKRGLGKPDDLTTEDSELALAAASYHSEGDFIRVWYVSDGWSVGTITYVAALGDEGKELGECEAIVRSIRFEDVRTARH